MQSSYGVLVRPFKTGKEMHEWCLKNCDSCKNYNECKLVRILLEAYTGIDKNIQRDIARQMGLYSKRRTCPAKRSSKNMKKVNMRVFLKTQKYEDWN